MASLTFIYFIFTTISRYVQLDFSLIWSVCWTLKPLPCAYRSSSRQPKPGVACSRCDADTIWCDGGLCRHRFKRSQPLPSVKGSNADSDVTHCYTISLVYCTLKYSGL